jgi:hypothetical protein
MNIPQFTAEASLYNAIFYGISAGLKANEPDRITLQRATGPYGPFGLPGQDCEGACMHLGSLSGGGLGCITTCRNTCTFYPGVYRL